MMWTVVMVLTTALTADALHREARSLQSTGQGDPMLTFSNLRVRGSNSSSSESNSTGLIIKHVRHRLTHGSRLKIFLSKNATKLEFTPVDDPSEVAVYWDSRFRAYKGRVVKVSTGTGVSRLSKNRRWYLDEVTHDDEGVYTLRDVWNKPISVAKVYVKPSQKHVKCVAGKSLTIPLAGIKLEDAFLSFSGKATNVTLVQNGTLVSQYLPGYWGRVKTYDTNIEIKDVDNTDEGQYTLRDRRGRVVSVTRMDLTDHRYSRGLTGLLGLLGIPAGLCYCFRKKIFKRKATASSTQAHTVMFHPPASDPQGPCPPYNTPGRQYYPAPNPNMGPAVHAPPENTGPGHWNAPAPSPGFNPAYPPQNVAYPPAGQQWNQYPPAPAPPVGYTPGPVMYVTPPPAAPTPAASEPVKGGLNMTSMASSPVASSLPAPTPAEAAPPPPPQAPVPPSSTEPLTSSDAAY